MVSAALARGSRSRRQEPTRDVTSERAGAPLSASVEDYLTAIYRLTSGGQVLGPSRLAEFMGLSAPSITLMIRRLVEQGLVVKDTIMGVALSPEGRERALGIIRRHRLSECFLVEKLGLDWGQAHVEAHRFEHALSPLVTEALARFLGHPSSCPHGHPIPQDVESGAPTCGLTLADVRSGERVVVRSVDEGSLEVLTWLQSMGLVPGATITVSQGDPTGATMLLNVGERWVACGTDLACCVQVERREDS